MQGYSAPKMAMVGGKGGNEGGKKANASGGIKDKNKLAYRYDIEAFLQ